MEDKELLKEAIQASTFAHIPYSKFAVGAALLLEDGKIIQGCNIKMPLTDLQIVQLYL